MNLNANVYSCMLMAWVCERSLLVKGVHHTTVITWVKQVGILIPDAYDPDRTPEVGELDGAGHAEVASAYAPHELATFVGSKKIKSGFGVP